jgi:hypothetical protein
VLPLVSNRLIFEGSADAFPAKLFEDACADAGAGAEAKADDELCRCPPVPGWDPWIPRLFDELEDDVTGVVPCVLPELAVICWPAARIS